MTDGTAGARAVSTISTRSWTRARAAVPAPLEGRRPT